MLNIYELSIDLGDRTRLSRGDNKRFLVERGESLKADSVDLQLHDVSEQTPLILEVLIFVQYLILAEISTVYDLDFMII